jgi:hypothetical protein
MSELFPDRVAYCKNLDRTVNSLFVISAHAMVSCHSLHTRAFMLYDIVVNIATALS